MCECFESLESSSSKGHHLHQCHYIFQVHKQHTPCFFYTRNDSGIVSHTPFLKLDYVSCKRIFARRTMPSSIASSSILAKPSTHPFRLFSKQYLLVGKHVSHFRVRGSSSLLHQTTLPLQEAYANPFQCHLA